MGKKLIKKNIIMDINAGWSVKEVAEYVGVSEKKLLAFMKENNIKTKKSTLNSLKNRLEKGLMSSSKPLKKSSAKFQDEDYEDDNTWLFMFKEFWKDIKTIPSWLKATITNKEFIVLSVFSLVLGGVMFGLWYLLCLIWNAF